MFLFRKGLAESVEIFPFNGKGVYKGEQPQW